MSLHKRLLILLAFFYSTSLLSQGGIIWEEAVPICGSNPVNSFVPLPDVEDYDPNALLFNLDPCNDGYSFNLQNPSWYSFVASNSTVSMDITIDNCFGRGHGVGVQYAMVEIIDGEPIVIDCNSDAIPEGVDNFTRSGLTVGQTYYLVLDGFAESVCEYMITNVSGLATNSINEPVANVYINDILGTDSGCKINSTYRVTAANASGGRITNATKYIWEIVGTSGQSYTQRSERTINFVEFLNIPAGTYSVSVQPINDCDNSQPAYEFDVTVDDNTIVQLPPSTLCIEDLNDEWDPTTLIPQYVGDPLTGLPTNPRMDTFYVDLPGSACTVQSLPINFINGSNIVDPGNVIDTTLCQADWVRDGGVFINGDLFEPRAEGSLPQYVTLGGACSNTYEVYVTVFVIGGEIVIDECSTGAPTLKFDPSAFEENFRDVEQYATYSWVDENNIEVSTNATFQPTQSGRYGLTIRLQKGNNPACFFPVGVSETIDISGIQELEVSCGASTTTSVSIQWNNINDVDNYSIGVNGRVIEQDLTFTTSNPMYVVNDNISEGDQINIAVFGRSDDPNCAPLRDTITCIASNCAPVGLVISNVGIPDQPSESICLSEDPTQLGDILTYQVTRTGGNGGGTGRWILTPRGNLPADDTSESISIDPNLQEPGEYILRYSYWEGDCSYVSENVKNIEIIKKPISTELTRRGRLELSDGICINERLRLNYDGVPVYNGTAQWGGDITNADVTGNLEDGFEMSFSTPGTKDITFMVEAGDGCNSLTESYQIEVGEPLPQLMIDSCRSTASGLEIFWTEDAQDCIEEYRIEIGGREIDVVTSSPYTYTTASSGNTYTIDVIAVSDCGCGEVAYIPITCTYDFEACEPVTIDLSENKIKKYCIINAMDPPFEIEVEVTSNTTLMGVGAWSIDTNDQALSASGMFDPVIAGVGDHVITYTWTEGNCPYSESITLTLADHADIDFNIVKIDPMCFGEDMGQVIVSSVGGSGDNEVFIDVASSTTPGSFETEFDLRSDSTYFITVLDTVTRCDTIAPIVINPGPDSLDLIRDSPPYLILDGQSFSETIDSTFSTLVDSLEWVYNGEPICDEIGCGLDFSFNPTESGTICFTAYYGDCPGYTECAEIEYLPEFKTFIPNVVSLASDATPMNKVFQVFTNDDQAVINMMVIYDRWGNQVYQNKSEGTVMVWDPSLNSQECTQGVYAYYLEITKGDGDTERKKGTLTLVK